MPGSFACHQTVGIFIGRRYSPLAPLHWSFGAVSVNTILGMTSVNNVLGGRLKMKVTKKGLRVTKDDNKIHVLENHGLYGPVHIWMQCSVCDQCDWRKRENESDT
jgi:hypothetical protein